VKSIRRQLTLSIFLGFGVLLLSSGAAIYICTRAALLHEFDAGLRAKAVAIMSLTEQGKDGMQFEPPGSYFSGGDKDSAPRFYELWSDAGASFARSPLLKEENLPRRYGPAGVPVYWNLELPDDQDGRAMGLKFAPKPEDEDGKHFSTQEAVVVVAADREALDGTLATLAGVLIVAVLVTMGMTIPLVNFSLRRGHAPLALLSQQAAAITADSLQARFPVDSMPEELQPIATRLNDLLGRLENSFARERRFSADLAHELRTPLAELRAQAEVELAWPESGETEKHRQTLEIALQMEAMVTRLLEMARCESGKIPLQIESVALAPLVDEMWVPLAAKAKEKRLAVEIDIPLAATLQTDRTLLRSILTNLFSNAVEYTQPEGRVEIAWDGGRREFAVRNTVEDLNAADVPHLFERLWRKDKARTGPEHCGLGLALSREFAAVLGFTLTAAFPAEKTLAITLTPRSNVE
jgi:two-component system sensor histidine kinase QseC